MVLGLTNWHTLARMNDNIKLLVSKKQLYHAGIVLLIIIISFISGYELGKKWGRSHERAYDTELSYENQYFTKGNDSIRLSGANGQDQQTVVEDQSWSKKSDPVEKSSDSKTSKVEIDSPGTGAAQNFVASRNGTKFYPAGCKSADRIKTENRVYFSTKDEAIRAGLEEATSC